MCDRISDFQHFYHITPDKNIDSIFKHGLDPNYFERELYTITEYKDNPFICLCTKKVKDKIAEALYDRFNNKLAILKIPASIVSIKKIAEDLTYTFTQIVKQSNPEADLFDIIEATGCLACFEKIEAEHIEISSYYPN